ncbi:MAG: signal peptidase I [Candidatus Aenigmarchaeota archaeon]|nr:signal peptidase I [Candidatus Aenigmarchaeota archaeon]
MAGLRKTWKKLTQGWFGYIFYAVLGIVIAFLVNQTLGFALTTDLPVVAVVTSSMEHDASTEINHYQWLEKNLGYNRSYIDSWPIATGFSIGDLPIVQGSGNYSVGDVIVYSVPGQRVPVIHRIIKINPDGSYMTKGDHNPSLLPFEHSVKKEWVHGKVIFIIPKLGYFKVIVSRLLGGAI